MTKTILVAAGALSLGVSAAVSAQSVMEGDVVIGERPVIENHVDQADIDSGLLNFNDVFDAGDKLFEARFNALDGQGRPGSTGTGADRVPDEPAFTRVSAPDANSCASCHNDPKDGGNGDFSVNVFVLAQALDPVTDSISGEFSNNRNTVGMHGAGAIEMLAREISDELIAIREEAAATAADSGASQRRELIGKGVQFGYITVLPDGRVDPTEIEGVDWDLIIKPFHQKGAVVSLREFTNNAMNHHHGMQTTERFGENLDPDLDGMSNELTVGDVTATTIYQAALPVPTRVIPAEPERQDAIVRGAATFRTVDCDSCHRPNMVLQSRFFTEPNPYNPPGNVQVGEIDTFSFDMTTQIPGNNLRPLGDDAALVSAFTDFKRHNLCDAEINHFCNEQVAQGTLAGFADPASFTVAVEPRPTEQFLSRRLWDVGNSMPYGHVGDLTTITEAIDAHGGDARASRDAFFALSEAGQADVIEFLKSLQIVDNRD